MKTRTKVQIAAEAGAQTAYERVAERVKTHLEQASHHETKADLTDLLSFVESWRERWQDP